MNRPMFLQPSRWGPGRRALNALLLLSLALGSVTAPEAWAFDLYVATSGDDSGGNDCQTQASPCKTLTYALLQASGATADVVNVAAGLYDTPSNGESFPLALVDGVVILGDTADPTTRTISAPAGNLVFFNNDTPLTGTTRLAGFTVTHDATTSSDLMDFAVGSSSMEPQIDHNRFLGFWDLFGLQTAISFYDDSTDDGSFAATIDNNTFTNLYEGIGSACRAMAAPATSFPQPSPTTPSPTATTRSTTRLVTPPKEPPAAP